MDVLHDLLPWGVNIIVRLQALGTPALDTFFALVTALGEAYTLFTLTALFFWCVGRETGMRFTFLLLLTLAVNQALKATFSIERPYVYYPSVQAKALYSGYAFPSGHAQLTTGMFGAVALRYRKAWFTWLSVIVVGLVSLSRVYLGVHYPQDVIAGIAVGLVCLVLLSPLTTRIVSWMTVGTWLSQLAMIVVPPALILFLSQHVYAWALASLILGLNSGYVLLGRLCPCSLDAGGTRCLLRGLVGLAACAIVYSLPSLIWTQASTPAPLIWDMARYGLLGITCTLGVPWLCCILGLGARREAALHS